MMDASSLYRLSPSAAIRPERFGGLVYRHDNRKLFILHSRLLVDFLRGLDGQPLSEALDDFVTARNETPAVREALLKALDQLKGIGVLEPVASGGTPHSVSSAHPPLPQREKQEGVRRRYENFQQGLDAPICLTWEITYACNLHCRHCLSSSGRRRPDELTTAEAKRLIDEWAAMQVFYINVGGGEPMSRPDFFELMDYALARRIGVKFSTNGSLLDDAAADWIVARDYLDVQISLDGADAETNDPVRGPESYARARRAMERLAARNFQFKINTVVTRQNYSQLDDLYAMASGYGAQLRVTRLRPTGRGRDVWEAMRPTREQNRGLYDWLLAHSNVLTGDSFFHLSAYGQPLDGLNMCGAGRIVCCVVPTGDVYVCPFMLAPEFAVGNVRQPGGFTQVWRSPLLASLRQPQAGTTCQSCSAYSLCHGGCPAVKRLTGRPVDRPDPDCVFGSD